MRAILSYLRARGRRLVITSLLFALLGLTLACEVDIDPTITTIAGSYSLGAGYSGDGGAASKASMNSPNAVTLNSAGILFIADQANHVVRAVNTQSVAVSVLGITTQPGNIVTVAGNYSLGGGYNGDGPATQSQLNSPSGLAVDAAGNLYIADQGNASGQDNLIRKVDTTGMMTTVAGNSSLSAGYSGDNGPATSAQLNKPQGIAVDGVGNLYIADQSNNLVRVVNMQASATTVLGVTIASGGIATVAGSAAGGYSGDSGPAASAQLNMPAGVAVDTTGNLYIADMNNNCIRRVDAGTFNITTVAGNVSKGAGYSGDDGAATSAQLNQPSGVAVDAFGILYIADANNNVVRIVNTQSLEATALGTPVHSGNIETVTGNGTAGYTGDNGPAISGTSPLDGSKLGATLSNPVATAVDPTGALYIADKNNNAVRKVASTSVPVSLPATAVGSSAPVTNLFFYAPPADNTQTFIYSVTSSSKEFQLGSFPVGANGTSGPSSNCAVGDGSTQYVSGVVCVLPITFQPSAAGLRQATLHVNTSQGQFYFGLSGMGLGPQVALLPGLASTAVGNGSAGPVSTGTTPATAATLNGPDGLAMDAVGNLYISDSQNSVIREVDATTHNITTFTDSATPSYTPGNLAFDAAGNLYIVDLTNNVVRIMAPGTTTSTVAENYAGRGVAVDPTGNLYIADSSNNVIRKLSAANVFNSTYATSPETPAQAATSLMTVVAGNGSQGYGGDSGLAIGATLNSPSAVASDAIGNLYIADTNNNVIRRVDARTRIITTVAGNQGNDGSYAGDNGPATSASLNSPKGIAIDPAGNLYIADSSNNAIRKVDAATQIITTLIGNGNVPPGYKGDNGPATAATLNNPVAVALDATGNLYIAEEANNVVREVSVNAAGIILNGVGQSNEQAVTASNIGNIPLVLTSVAPLTANFTVDPGSSCLTVSPLAVGASCQAFVFPPVAGNFSDNLVFTDNALNVSGATQEVSLLIGQGPQTINFPNPGTQVYGVAPITLNATASSFLPVIYTVTSGPATVIGNTLTITAAGSVTVQADQTGSINYFPAPSVSVTFTVNEEVGTYSVVATTPTATMAAGATSTATLTLTSNNYTGTVSFVATSITSTDGEASDITVSASPVTLTQTGTGTSTVTITSVKSTANRGTAVPWKSGSAVLFFAALLAVPSRLRRKRVVAGLILSVTILLTLFLMACSEAPDPTGKPARTYIVTLTPTGTQTPAGSVSVTDPKPVNLTVLVY